LSDLQLLLDIRQELNRIASSTGRKLRFGVSNGERKVFDSFLKGERESGCFGEVRENGSGGGVA